MKKSIFSVNSVVRYFTKRKGQGGVLCVDS
jgi:hypothetical protein